MASKAVYRATALVVIAALSGAAWWYQNRPSSDAKVVAAGPAGTPAAAGSPGPAVPGGGKPSVEVAKVEVMKLVDETQTVGSLRSRQGVMVRPEVSGRITQLNFRDGDRVRKGQLLVQFDDQLQVAQIRQADAELSIAQANFNRNKELADQNFISRRTVDESAAGLQVAEAKLSLAKATAARLKILAPFDGSVGIRQVNLGDYLKDGADIVNLEDIEAVFVDFRLPERFQTKVRRGQTAVLDIDALPGRKFSALVQAIDPLIDANGRSLGIRACIDNRRQQLRPGMFARVNSVFGERDNARVVPEEAIVPQGGRQFVVKLVDGPDGKVSQRVEVKVGLRSPGKVEILEGLQPGETIVITGQQRVNRDGTAVRVVEIPAGGRPGAGPGGPGGPGGPSGPGAAPAGAGPAGQGDLGRAGGPAGPGGPSGASAKGPNAGGARGPAARNLPPLEGPDPCLMGMASGPAGSPSGDPSERARGAMPPGKPPARPAQGPA